MTGELVSKLNSKSLALTHRPSNSCKMTKSLIQRMWHLICSRSLVIMTFLISRSSARNGSCLVCQSRTLNGLHSRSKMTQWLPCSFKSMEKCCQSSYSSSLPSGRILDRLVRSQSSKMKMRETKHVFIPRSPPLSLSLQYLKIRALLTNRSI